MVVLEKLKLHRIRPTAKVNSYDVALLLISQGFATYARNLLVPSALEPPAFCLLALVRSLILEFRH
jgi:hypothetical protein